MIQDAVNDEIAPDGPAPEEEMHEEALELDVLAETMDDAGGPPLDDPVTDDGDALPDEVRAELEALAAAELEHGTEVEQALATAQRDLARQRAETQAALDRYREAILASEPELPPDLVRGETVEELEAAIASARQVVARVREQVQTSAPAAGFPVGAPAREPSRRPRGMTPAEKIAAGLGEREQG